MTLRYTTPGVYVERLDTDPQRIQLRRTDVAGFVGLAARGPLNAARKVESWRQFVSTFGETIPDAYLGYAVRGFFENGGRTCWVVRTGNPKGTLAARVQLEIEGYGALGLEAATPGAWGDTLTVTAVWERDRVIALAIGSEDGQRQRIELYDMAAGQKIHTNLLGVSDAALADAGSAPLVTVVDLDGSMPRRPLGTRNRSVRLSGGADGPDALRLEHLLGNYEDRVPSGLAALERVDGVSFVAVPDLMIGQDPRATPFGPPGFGKDRILEAHEAILASCKRCGDRMAILDLPPAFDVSAAMAYPRSLPRESTGALYYPWILVDDPLRLVDLVRAVPPSGHVAGVFAQVDRRRGVHQPPANQPLEGARDVTRSITARSHGDLNDAGVNAIRPVSGRGVLVLGARTLDPDVRWRYVNIRRLFLMVEETLDEQLQWLVFEPNNPRLWREVERVVGAFLERLYRLGMLDGATAEQAYLVRCDASTNPPSETDAGRITCFVGLQPPYPAEFVIVRLGLTRDGVEIAEREAHNV